jgi:hypothetical protein
MSQSIRWFTVSAAILCGCGPAASPGGNGVAVPAVAPVAHGIGEVAAAGDAAVTLRSAGIGFARLRSVTGEAEQVTADRRLILTFSVANTAENKRLEFFGWQLTHHNGYRDDHDNKYRMLEPGIGEVAVGDTVPGLALNPGDSAVNVLLLEAPIDSASEFTIELNPPDVNAPPGAAPLRFKFTRDQLTPFPQGK